MNTPDLITSSPTQQHRMSRRPNHFVVWIIVVAVLSCCVFLCWWAAKLIGNARQAAQMCNCSSYIFKVGMALKMYHLEYDCYPPAHLSDENGKPIHSWRVLILPVWEERCLSGEAIPKCNFEEPWDSPNNRQVLTNHPFREMFACPLDDDAIALGLTSYVAVVGDNTMWPGQQSRSETDKITGDTILLIEIPNSDISWTEPRDISFQEALNLFSTSKNGLRNSNRHGALHYLTVNGVYRRFSSIETVEEFARLLQVGGPEKKGGAIKRDRDN